jgi:indole-3-glycerol phosphate synthase
MTTEEDLAPAVREILAAARDRPGGADRMSVESRSLGTAIRETNAAGEVPIVAEIKPTSPTTEGHRDDDPVEVAEAMVDGGATALSVLTEPDYFGGSLGTLSRVRDAVTVPVLRKDFILEEPQLDAVEADAVLLIGRFLDDLGPMVEAARSRGFEPLVEVHSEAEIESALDAGASLIGINNRDLARLEVDLGTFERLAPEVPSERTLIAESGIQGPADVRRMRRAGADALLVGSALMAGDTRSLTRSLVRAEAD